MLYDAFVLRERELLSMNSVFCFWISISVVVVRASHLKYLMNRKIFVGT